MRRMIITANWKMHGSIAGLESYFSQFESSLDASFSEITSALGLCFALPMPFIASARALLAHKPLTIAAQNCHWEKQGAFTGEVSPIMLSELGVHSCLVGHSERRRYFGETDDSIGLKIQSLVKAGIQPILCVGESAEERQKGLTEKTLSRQLKLGLQNVELADLGSLVIAYEPVWAIGSGQSALPSDANAAHAHIRDWLGDCYGEMVAKRQQIIYGGSLKPGNCLDLLAAENIDGGLVGGASLNAGEFADFVNAALKLSK